MIFDREAFFDCVREKPFGGSLTQDQVSGMNAILNVWETSRPSEDLRHLAYPLATTYHETAQTMQPISEYGQGAGHEYGEVDPETGQTYYGRGFVQLTWRDNYRKADQELGLAQTISLEWQADNALLPSIAAAVMFRGMFEGWFRGSGLWDYFNDTDDDPYGAREIINGDKHIVPSWSNGVSIGNLIAGYHRAFLEALDTAYIEVELVPAPTITVKLELQIDLANSTATATVLDVTGGENAQGLHGPDWSEAVGSPGKGKDRKPDVQKEGKRRVPVDGRDQFLRPEEPRDDQWPGLVPSSTKGRPP
jgi:hypothetical protein